MKTFLMGFLIGGIVSGLVYASDYSTRQDRDFWFMESMRQKEQIQKQRNFQRQPSVPCDNR